MKKFLAGLIFATSILSNSSANAFGNLWYDQDSNFGSSTSFVVLPVEDLSQDTFTSNSYVVDRLQKSMKKVQFIPLGSNFERSFESESERANAIRKYTNADFYIVPRIYRNELQIDTSPEKTVKVDMKSWLEISGSPHGRNDGKHHRQSWTGYHTIPEKDVYLRIMELDFTVYDFDGNEVFTYDNKNYSDDQSSSKLFEKLTDDFSKTFENARKDQQSRSKNKKSKKNSTTIKIEPLILPENIEQDRFLNAAVNFAYIGEAEERLKKYTFVDDSADYTIVGTIHDSSYNFKWHEPDVTTSETEVESESFEWRDHDDKKHTETRKYYETEVKDHYGYWSASARVSATFRLIDATGKTVVEYSKTETDDKEIDATHHILKDFYKKVEKHLKD